MGRIICCGLGPGDPDLMSVRADREIRAARHVAYFRKKGRPGQARRIVDALLAQDVLEYPMEYPVTTELPLDGPEYARLLACFYDDWAQRLVEIARKADVIVLCEGDPFFYGSFMYLYARLAGRCAVAVVPGVSSLTACAGASGGPLALRNETLTILPGPLPEAELKARLAATDAAAIVKVGRHFAKIRRVIRELGLEDRAHYVERATLPTERYRPLSELKEDSAPYFSMILIRGQG
jgi:precorrin-2/cobalt-factor-2 C20-methyltransferase